mmetsp:Transcript_58254/g.147981  ORF Transcript_58254/g.147981 Transcript_58254/m.147981 type:complete len:373 (-) Transcript_58254:192-1310(-)
MLRRFTPEDGNIYEVDIDAEEELDEVLPLTGCSTVAVAALLTATVGSLEEHLARAAVQDTIDASCFPNELLAIWCVREDRAHGPHVDAGLIAVPMPPDAAASIGNSGRHVTEDARGPAVWLISQLTEHMGLPSRAFAQAVTMLDIYCARMHGAIGIEALPGTCVAICSLIHKTEVPSEPVDGRLLQSAATWWSKCLETSGRDAVPIALKQLRDYEESILKTFQWQINFPNVESWMLAFCGRLDAASGGVFRRSLTWVMHQGVVLAKVILQRVSVMELRSHRFACALCVLGLVAARLLPLSALRPDREIGIVEWERLYLQTGWVKELPTCVLPEQSQDGFGKLMEIVMNSRLSALRRDALLLATITQRVFTQG